MKEYRNNESSSAQKFRVWTCGTFRVERLIDTTTTYEQVRAAEWRGSNSPRLLLKALLCCPGRRARRETLIEMLCPTATSSQATQYLNAAATRLRSVLRPSKACESLLVTEENASSYLLEPQKLLWIDIDASLTLLREAERIGRTTAEALSLEEEIATYLNRGIFLEGEDGPWLQKQRKSVEDTQYRCQLWLAEAYEQQKMPGQAETILRGLFADDPSDEDVLRRLMSFLHRHGMTHKGCRIFEEAKQLAQAGGRHFSQAMLTFAEGLCNEPRTEGESTPS